MKIRVTLVEALRRDSQKILSNVHHLKNARKAARVKANFEKVLKFLPSDKRVEKACGKDSDIMEFYWKKAYKTQDILAKALGSLSGAYESWHVDEQGRNMPTPESGIFAQSEGFLHSNSMNYQNWFFFAVQRLYASLDPTAKGEFDGNDVREAEELIAYEDYLYYKENPQYAENDGYDLKLRKFTGGTSGEEAHLAAFEKYCPTIEEARALLEKAEAAADTVKIHIAKEAIHYYEQQAKLATADSVDPQDLEDAGLDDL